MQIGEGSHSPARGGAGSGVASSARLSPFNSFIVITVNRAIYRASQAAAVLQGGDRKKREWDRKQSKGAPSQCTRCHR